MRCCLNAAVDQKRAFLGMTLIMSVAFVASLVLSVIAGTLLFHPAAGAVYLTALGLMFVTYWCRFVR